MEERRGESIDETMKKAGPVGTGYFTIEQARAAAQGQCDEEGIDPTWTNAERCTRLIDIQQGSPLMHEERQRKAAYTSSLESFKEPVFKTVSVGDPQAKKLIDESERDKFLGGIVRQRGARSITGFYIGEQLVGFAVPRKDSDGRYRTGAIYVTPSFQGKGVATAFTRSYFKDRSGRAMIELDNTKSQHLFGSIGFKRSGKTIKDDEGTSYEIWLLN